MENKQTIESVLIDIIMKKYNLTDEQIALEIIYTLDLEDTMHDLVYDDFGNEDINSMSIIISKLKQFDTDIKRLVNYYTTTDKQYSITENEFQGNYTQAELIAIYNQEIDKKEYQTFDIWLDDMLKMDLVTKNY